MSRITRRDFLKKTIVAGAGVGAASLASACAPAATPTAEPTKAAPAATPTKAPAVVTPPAKTTFNIGLQPLPINMHPHYESGAIPHAIFVGMFDPLVSVPAEGGLIPWLAESWRIIDDLTWEFRIREGVKFHNGEELDAEVVKWNLDWTLNPDNESRFSSRIAEIESVDVVDAKTIKVHTKVPYGSLLEGLTTFYMLPPAYYEEVGKEGFYTKPVGTGPFRCEEFVVDEYVRLVAFDDCWRGSPRMKELMYKGILEAAALLAALQAGEVDIAWQVLPEYVQGLKDDGFKVVEGLTGYQFQLWMKDWWEPFDDKRVRQAMNYAVDIDAMHQSIMLGYGERLQGQMGNHICLGYVPDLKSYPHDPEKAKELLAEAEYGDGLEFVCGNWAEGKYMKSKEVCEATADQLSEIGVTMNIETYELAKADAMWRDATLGPMLVFGWQVRPAMSEHRPYSNCVMGRPFRMIENEEFDALFHAQETTLDPEERKKKLQDLNRWVHDYCPSIFMWSFPGLYAMNPEVENYEPSASYSVDWINMGWRS